MLALAWRNLWRNRRRTTITLSMVTLAAMILILFQSLMDGLVRSAVANATTLSVGEVQVHAPEYLEERSFYDAIDEPHRIVEEARRRGIDAAPRSYGYGLLARGHQSTGARFQGIDPSAERATFELARNVARGRFLEETSRGEVVLGRKLARILDANVGDEVIVVVQAADGSLGNELFTVAGILKTVNEAIDRSTALVHRADFEALFVSGGRIHEIALSSHDTIPLDELRHAVESMAPGEDVRTWRRLLPVVSDMIALMDRFLWIFASIFFLAAGLGVMNTMLMATHERMREFGVLKAIGTSPRRIVRDVVIEASILAVLATSAGAILGSGFTLGLAHYGIDTARLAGETSLGGIAFDPVWRPALTVEAVRRAVVALFGASVIATLYPAILAARLNPIQAMQRR